MICMSQLLYLYNIHQLPWGYILVKVETGKTRLMTTVVLFGWSQRWCGRWRCRNRNDFSTSPRTNNNHPWQIINVPGTFLRVSSVTKKKLQYIPSVCRCFEMLMHVVYTTSPTTIKKWTFWWITEEKTNFRVRWTFILFTLRFPWQ